MDGAKLVKFLKLLRDTGCLDKYWKNRIDDIIMQMGGQP